MLKNSSRKIEFLRAASNMANLSQNCKTWISCLQSLNLEDIDLKILENIKHNDKDNKSLFKVLLYLSHCADKCYKENLSKEKFVFTIANAICQNLTNVIDKNKLFSALYYIAYYLLNRQSFKEAKIISKYLLPGTLVDANDYKNTSKYYQIGSLWQSALFTRLDGIKSKTCSVTDKIIIDDNLISYVIFYFKILDYCDDDCHTFNAADAYVRKLASFPLEMSFSCLEKIFEHLSMSMRNLKKVSLVEAYNLFITTLGYAFFKRTDAINNSNILNCFLKCDSYFYILLLSSPQCRWCYQLFREFSLNIFETNFMTTEIGNLRLKKCFAFLKALLNNFGTNNNLVVKTLVAVSYSFKCISRKWEDLGVMQLANTQINIDLKNFRYFLKSIQSILKSHGFYTNSTCEKSSKPEKYLDKEDIYNALIIISTYLRVPFTDNTINLKIFLMAKDILDLMLSAYNNLNASNCKSIVPWHRLGRLIFNVGIMSESKYPEEMQKLYEVLCLHIIRHDVIDAKVSNFGLKNAIGIALHCLSNANQHQIKYKEAMSYTACNAFLNTVDDRNKTAVYNTWANIKLKLIDCMEMEDLTISKNLKVDANVVKKLGVAINLKNYDYNSSCLKELESLFILESNVIRFMKTKLDELDASESTLEYAKGTLLLCFHVHKLKNRELILYYINKAIKKLNKLNKKTSDLQFFLANLNFFNLIEKLYIRKQNVKQKKANYEEDQQISNEFHKIANLWTNCLQENIGVITNGWIHKLTLETIIICGEYCRLYKFNVIEGKIWKLAYTLSTALQEFAACVYVTSRSISLRQIDEAMLTTAEKYVESLKNSSTKSETDIVALFWLSLADFYLDCKKNKEAKLLIDYAKTISNFNNLDNTQLCLYSAVIQFRNYSTLNSKFNQESYCQLITEIDYLLINGYELVTKDVTTIWEIKFQLFAFEQIFEALSNVVIPMNSLVGYYYVFEHLKLGFTYAKMFRMSLRIAEFLKYICYFDLIRLQISDCESHLQDLEYVLCLGRFEVPKKTRCQGKTINLDEIDVDETLCETLPVTPVNLKKNSASPELKKKLFLTPEFMDHTRYCQCFYCTNLHYQYLTFSCNHIQAQLFTLLKYTQEADCFFNGTCKIKRHIEAYIDSDAARQYKVYHWKKQQKYVVDSLLYLLDFSMFIDEFIPDRKDDASCLIEKTLEIAAENDLSNKNCVSLYATELYNQHYFYEKFSKLEIYVPYCILIDVTNEQPTANNLLQKDPKPVRRSTRIEEKNAKKINSDNNLPVSEPGTTSIPETNNLSKKNTQKNRKRVVADDPLMKLGVRRSERLAKKKN